MNKPIKNIGTGIGAVGLSLAASSNVIPGIGTCTGTCGACGLSCLVPIVGVSSMLILSIKGKKLKIKK